MEKELLSQFFENSRLISRLTAEKIADYFERKDIKKNKFLLKERQISNEYFFLERGFMRAFAHTPKGQDVTTAFYSHRQLVFEVSSFFMRTSTKENIQALTDCTGWYITYDQLNMLFHTLPEFREFGRFILVNGLTSLKSRMLSAISEPAEKRYVDLIENKPEIFQYASLKHIASYIGVTDTSLSRIRKEFSQKI